MIKNQSDNLRRYPKGFRFAIFKRDKFTCHYCGRKPPEVELHLDHIVAVVHGGDSSKSNLITSCRDCNFIKHSDSVSPADRTIQEFLNFNNKDRGKTFSELNSQTQKSTFIRYYGESFALKLEVLNAIINRDKTLSAVAIRHGVSKAAVSNIAKKAIAAYCTIGSKQFITPRDMFLV